MRARPLAILCWIVLFAVAHAQAQQNPNNLNIARRLHSATLLNNGTVLVAGGYNANASVSAELYDPATKAFTLTGNLNTGRNSQTATLLSNGMVLITGGISRGGSTLASAELYDPSSGSFTVAGSLHTARYSHTATLLNSGMVLIVGGGTPGAYALATAELFDPASGTFTATGNLNSARAYHTATLLNDGTVLIAGGYDNNANNVATAELFNPANGTFTATGSLNASRNSHTATLLNSGKVLIVGGFDDNYNVLSSAELYDPGAAIFTYTGSPNTPREAYTATLLNDGTVLLEGGYDTNYNDTANAEFYDPGSGTFATSSSATVARDSHTATRLSDGTVLVAGGEDNFGNELANAELYQPSVLTPSGLASVAISPFNPSVPIASAQRFTAIGTFGDNTTQTLVSVTWSSSDSTVASVTGDATNQGSALAVSTGPVTLHACAGSVCGSTPMTVSASALISVAIAPANSTALIGSSVQFQATGTFANGNSQDLTSSVTWNSSSLMIATINSMGSASTFSKGITTITASMGNISASTTLVVTPPLSSIAIAPQNPLVLQGNTQQFVVTGTYADGSTANLTNSSNWSSSASAIATINSTGLATTIALGTTTITASSGGLSSSTALNVTAALVSIAINPQSPSIASGLKQTLAATGTYADGTTRDLTSLVNWSSSMVAVAAVSSTGLVTAASQGTTTISANLGDVSRSATLTVAAPMLLTTVLSPQNPAVPIGANVQFVATGRYSDGVTRDITSSAAWTSSNSTAATVGTNGIATAINPGSSAITGSLNGITFSTNITVSSVGPPVITASLSPAPNAAGWNNSNVTVTFLCTPGSAAITSCPGPQTVTSEGANQVVSGTVTDAAGGTATASASLNIDKTLPTLALASPADGTVFTVAGISASGTLTDGFSGIASLTCNGVAVTLTGADFSCNISLNPGVNLIVVRAADVAGNIALTKMHVKLDAPLPPPNSLQITPSNVNLVVGDTQQFTAIDELGRRRTDATWTVSDTTITAITTDSQPVLTALGIGQVTLTVAVQGLSSQIQVNILAGSLPSGSRHFSNQPLPGYESLNVLPAVPSADGPGFYSLEYNPSAGPVTALRAFTADGQLLWQQASGTNGITYSLIPDAFGGVIANTLARLSVMDSQTGSVIWEHSTGGEFLYVAVRQDGAVVTVESTPDARSPVGMLYTPQKYLDVFDGNTGQLTLQLPLPQYTESHHELGESGPGSGCTPLNFDLLVAGDTSPITVDINGNIFVEYSVPNYTRTMKTDCGSPFVIVDTTVIDSSARLLTVSVDGSSSTQTLSSNTEVYSYVYTQDQPTTGSGSGLFSLVGEVIPDGQGGALASWHEGPSLVPGGPNLPLTVTHVSPDGGGTYSLPMLDSHLVLGENGIAFAVGTPLDGGARAVSFDMNSGQISWSYEPPTGSAFSILAIRPGNGLVAKETDQHRQDSVIHFDESGQPTYDSVFGTGIGIDWQGQLYDVYGSIAGMLIPVTWANDWAEPQGNSSKNGMGVVHHSFGLFWCGSGYGEQGSCTQDPFNVGGADIPFSYAQAINFNVQNLNDFGAAHPGWVDIIKNAALNAFQSAFKDFPVVAVPASTSMQRSFLSCLHSPGFKCPLPDQEHIAYVVGDWLPGVSGYTPSANVSRVYYLTAMQNAQNATNVSPVSIPTTSPAINDFVTRLLPAIGTGIGNTAAHELGHQMAFSVVIIMDCDEPGANRPCATGDDHLFERYAPGNWHYLHIYPDMQWQKPDSVCAIHQFSLKSYRNKDEQCLSDLTK